MTADVELLPDEVVAKFCDRMLTAAIGADWRQRAPEAVTAFWMDEVRAALQEAIAAKDAEVARWREAAEWQGAMTKELLLYQDEAVAGRAKIEALRAEMERLKRIEFCWGEWLEKTEWVQQTCKPKELGMHRADVMRLRLEQAEARAERLAGALRRYRDEVPLGHQPHMLAHEVDDLLHPTAAQENDDA
ncbi:MAG TPA: hypothetical protein PKZ27_03065 [Rhodocyclaceae bacterium]|nr:hypothetical protein [Rhodocyclaceae bacterium]